MLGIRSYVAVLCLLLFTAAPYGAARAQEAEQESEEKKRKWTNSTELSLVVTEGNSNTQTFGFNDTFRFNWEENARFQLKLQATKSNTADDVFKRVDPGFTWVPGEDVEVSDLTTTVVEPAVEPDVEIYFVEGRYDRKLSDRRTWNAGASWDRNLDAGILSRSILFAGLGSIFWDRDDLKFNVSYGLSYTDRDEEEPDTEKDDQFPGLRFTWDYMNKWGKNTQYDNDLTFNISLSDRNDWSISNTSTVAVSMNSRLALSFSLQFLYNNEPALEDADVIAFVKLNNEDGIPGSGDEFFETVDGPGEDIVEIELGSDRVRKKELDTVIRTSLVINF
jgi:putative salt-induced outer membrane protein YdiY